jgi:hypothetical protein
MKDEASTRCHCNNCGRGTGHSVIDKRTVHDEDEPDEDGSPPFYWEDTYEVLQCRGCGSVTLKHYTLYASGEEDVAFYPPRVSRRAPSWQWKLPSEMRELLNEIYAALHSNGKRLALMGARTLVDMLMTHEIGNKGTFDARLKLLRDRGVVSERNRDILATVLDAGSAAAHRGYKPKSEELDAVMDIVENLLQAAHHLPKVAADLKKKIPARPK